MSGGYFLRLCRKATELGGAVGIEIDPAYKAEYVPNLKKNTKVRDYSNDSFTLTYINDPRMRSVDFKIINIPDLGISLNDASYRLLSEI